jgi:hypothetical protein
LALRSPFGCSAAFGFVASPSSWMLFQIRVAAVVRFLNFLTGVTPGGLFQMAASRSAGQPGEHESGYMQGPRWRLHERTLRGLGMTDSLPFLEAYWVQSRFHHSIQRLLDARRYRQWIGDKFRVRRPYLTGGHNHISIRNERRAQRTVWTDAALTCLRNDSVLSGRDVQDSRLCLSIANDLHLELKDISNKW